MYGYVLGRKAEDTNLVFFFHFLNTVSGEAYAGGENKIRRLMRSQIASKSGEFDSRTGQAHASL